MSRIEFLSELRRRLNGLPQEEIENAVSYYAEYFEDAGPENERRVLDELGSPAHAAAQIIGAYASSGAHWPRASKPRQPRRDNSLKIVGIVLLAIFAAPMAIPIAAAVFSLAVALLAVVFSIVVSFGAVALSLVVSGVVVTAVGIPIFIQHPPTGLVVLGAGLIVAAVGLLFTLATVYIAKGSLQFISYIFGKFLVRKTKNVVPHPPTAFSPAAYQPYKTATDDIIVIQPPEEDEQDAGSQAHDAKIDEEE